MGTSFFGTSYGGTGVYGKDGSLLTYNIVNYGTPAAPKYYLTVWNMSAIDSMLAAPTGTGYWQWRPSGGGFPGIPLGYYVHDGNTGYSLNVSIPNIDGPRNAILNQTGSIYCIRQDEFIIAGTSGQNNELGVVPGYLVKLSLEKGKEGTKLWDKTFTPPFASIDLNQTGGGFFSVGLTMVGVYPEYDVIIFKNPKLLNYYAISTETGQQLWESEPEEQMNFYTMITNVYEGKLLTCGFGGVLNAYNITTGEILWSYTAKNEGFESPYGNYPLNIFAICDGKLYTLTGEHSISQPIWRGHNLRCINATDGTEIWKLLNFGANGGASLQGQYLQMADGKVVGLNFFDNMIYCIGKGSSDTTVTASPKTSVHGTSVLIEGTVTDATDSGKRNTNDLLDFSLNGTPAISDEDMGAWMEYMFMQQAFPADAKGVEVVLESSRS